MSEGGKTPAKQGGGGTKTAHGGKDRNVPAKGKGDGKKGGDGKGKDNGPHKGGSGPKNSGKGGHKGSGRYGAVGGYKGVPVKKAERLVNSQMNSLIRAIERDKAKGIRASDSEVRKADELYGRSTGDLNAIFSDVLGYVDNMGTKIHDQNAQTAGQINQMQQANRQQITDTTSATQQAALAEMQRLGIRPDTLDPRFGADAQFTQNVAAQTDSNNQANMAMQSANADQISALLGGMTQGARATSLGQATNTHNSSVSDIMNDRRDMEAMFRDEVLGVQKDKPGAVLELLQQMQETGFNQWVGLQGVRMDRANLKMDRRQLNAQIAAQRAQSAQEAAYAKTSAGLWSGAASSSGGVGYGSGSSSGYVGHAKSSGSGSSGYVGHKSSAGPVRHSILEPQLSVPKHTAPKKKKSPPPRHSILEPRLSIPKRGSWGWKG